MKMDIHLHWRNKEPFTADVNGCLYEKVRQTSARIAIGISRSNQADGLDDLLVIFFMILQNIVVLQKHRFHIIR